MDGPRGAGVAGQRPGDAEKQDRARAGERKFVVRLAHGRGIAGAQGGGVARWTFLTPLLIQYCCVWLSTQSRSERPSPERDCGAEIRAA